MARRPPSIIRPNLQPKGRVYNAPPSVSMAPDKYDIGALRGVLGDLPGVSDPGIDSKGERYIPFTQKTGEGEHETETTFNIYQDNRTGVLSIANPKSPDTRRVVRGRGFADTGSYMPATDVLKSFISDAAKGGKAITTQLSEREGAPTLNRGADPSQWDMMRDSATMFETRDSTKPGIKTQSAIDLMNSTNGRFIMDHGNNSDPKSMFMGDRSLKTRGLAMDDASGTRSYSVGASWKRFKSNHGTNASFDAPGVLSPVRQAGARFEGQSQATSGRLVSYGYDLAGMGAVGEGGMLVPNNGPLISTPEPTRKRFKLSDLSPEKQEAARAGDFASVTGVQEGQIYQNRRGWIDPKIKEGDSIVDGFHKTISPLFKYSQGNNLLTRVGQQRIVEENDEEWLEADFQSYQPGYQAGNKASGFKDELQPRRPNDSSLNPFSIDTKTGKVTQLSLDGYATMGKIKDMPRRALESLMQTRTTKELGLRYINTALSKGEDGERNFKLLGGRIVGRDSEGYNDPEANLISRKQAGGLFNRGVITEQGNAGAVWNEMAMRHLSDEKNWHTIITPNVAMGEDEYNLLAGKELKDRRGNPYTVVHPAGTMLPDGNGGMREATTRQVGEDGTVSYIGQKTSEMLILQQAHNLRPEFARQERLISNESLDAMSNSNPTAYAGLMSMHEQGLLRNSAKSMVQVLAANQQGNTQAQQHLADRYGVIDFAESGFNRANMEFSGMEESDHIRETIAALADSEDGDKAMRMRIGDNDFFAPSARTIQSMFTEDDSGDLMNTTGKKLFGMLQSWDSVSQVQGMGGKAIKEQNIALQSTKEGLLSFAKSVEQPETIKKFEGLQVEKVGGAAFSHAAIGETEAVMTQDRFYEMMGVNKFEGEERAAAIEMAEKARADGTAGIVSAMFPELERGTGSIANLQVKYDTEIRDRPGGETFSMGEDQLGVNAKIIQFSKKDQDGDTISAFLNNQITRGKDGLMRLAHQTKLDFTSRQKIDDLSSYSDERRGIQSAEVLSGTDFLEQVREQGKGGFMTMDKVVQKSTEIATAKGQVGKAFNMFNRGFTEFAETRFGQVFDAMGIDKDKRAQMRDSIMSPVDRLSHRISQQVVDFKTATNETMTSVMSMLQGGRINSTKGAGKDATAGFMKNGEWTPIGKGIANISSGAIRAIAAVGSDVGGYTDKQGTRKDKNGEDEEYDIDDRSDEGRKFDRNGRPLNIGMAGIMAQNLMPIEMQDFGTADENGVAIRDEAQQANYDKYKTIQGLLLDQTKPENKEKGFNVPSYLDAIGITDKRKGAQAAVYGGNVSPERAIPMLEYVAGRLTDNSLSAASRPEDAKGHNDAITRYNPGEEMGGNAFAEMVQDGNKFIETKRANEDKGNEGALSLKGMRLIANANPDNAAMVAETGILFDEESDSLRESLAKQFQDIRPLKGDPNASIPSNEVEAMNETIQPQAQVENAGTLNLDGISLIPSGDDGVAPKSNAAASEPKAPSPRDARRKERGQPIGDGYVPKSMREIEDKVKIGGTLSGKEGFERREYQSQAASAKDFFDQIEIGSSVEPEAFFPEGASSSSSGGSYSGGSSEPPQSSGESSAPSPQGGGGSGRGGINNYGSVTIRQSRQTADVAQDIDIAKAKLFQKGNARATELAGRYNDGGVLSGNEKLELQDHVKRLGQMRSMHGQQQLREGLDRDGTMPMNSYGKQLGEMFTPNASMESNLYDMVVNNESPLAQASMTMAEQKALAEFGVDGAAKRSSIAAGRQGERIDDRLKKLGYGGDNSGTAMSEASADVSKVISEQSGGRVKSLDEALKGIGEISKAFETLNTHTKGGAKNLEILSKHLSAINDVAEEIETMANSGDVAKMDIAAGKKADLDKMNADTIGKILPGLGNAEVAALHGEKLAAESGDIQARMKIKANQPFNENEERAKLDQMLMSRGGAGRRARSSEQFEEYMDRYHGRAKIGGEDGISLENVGVQGAAAGARAIQSIQGVAFSGMMARGQILNPLIGAAQEAEKFRNERQNYMMQSGGTNYNDAMSGSYGNYKRRLGQGESFMEAAGGQIYDSWVGSVSGHMNATAGRNVGGVASVLGPAAAAGMVASSINPMLGLAVGLGTAAVGTANLVNSINEDGLGKGRVTYGAQGGTGMGRREALASSGEFVTAFADLLAGGNSDDDAYAELFKNIDVGRNGGDSKYGQDLQKRLDTGLSAKALDFNATKQATYKFGGFGGAVQQVMDERVGGGLSTEQMTEAERSALQSEMAGIQNSSFAGMTDAQVTDKLYNETFSKLSAEEQKTFKKSDVRGAYLMDLTERWRQEGVGLDDGLKSLSIAGLYSDEALKKEDYANQLVALNAETGGGFTDVVQGLQGSSGLSPSQARQSGFLQETMDSTRAAFEGKNPAEVQASLKWAQPYLDQINQVRGNSGQEEHKFDFSLDVLDARGKVGAGLTAQLESYSANRLVNSNISTNNVISQSINAAIDQGDVRLANRLLSAPETSDASSMNALYYGVDKEEMQKNYDSGTIGRETSETGAFLGDAYKQYQTNFLSSVGGGSGLPVAGLASDILPNAMAGGFSIDAAADISLFKDGMQNTGAATKEQRDAAGLKYVQGLFANNEGIQSTLRSAASGEITEDEAWKNISKELSPAEFERLQKDIDFDMQSKQSVVSAQSVERTSRYSVMSDSEKQSFNENITGKGVLDETETALNSLATQRGEAASFGSKFYERYNKMSADELSANSNKFTQEDARLQTSLGFLGQYETSGWNSTQINSMGGAMMRIGAQGAVQEAQMFGILGGDRYAMSQNTGMANNLLGRLSGGSFQLPVAPVNLQTGQSWEYNNIQPLTQQGGSTTQFLRKDTLAGQQGYFAGVSNQSLLKGTAGLQAANMNLQMGASKYNYESGRAMQVAGIDFETKGWNGNRSQYAIEDDQVRLSRAKQDFGLVESEKNLKLGAMGLGLKISQFEEGFGLNQRKFNYNTSFQRNEMNIGRGQSLIQRGQQKDDMAFNRNVSNLEFGWQMEDSNRNIRYARGRDRVDQMREKDRNVTRFSMQEGQRDKEENRFEERAKWEDESFERQKNNFEQTTKFSLEEMEMSKKHFYENLEMDKQRQLMSQISFEQQKIWMNEERALEDENRVATREFKAFQNNMNLEISKNQYETQMAIQRNSNAITGLGMAADELNKKTDMALKGLIKNLSDFQAKATAVGNSISNSVSNAGAGSGVGLPSGGSNYTPPVYNNNGVQVISPIGGNGNPPSNGNPRPIGWIGVWSGASGGMVGSHQMAAMSADFSMGAPMKAFSGGGYTGDGMKNEVKGVVHGGEYVVPQGGSLVLRGNDEVVKVLNEVKAVLTRIEKQGAANINATIYTSDKQMKAGTLRDAAYASVGG